MICYHTMFVLEFCVYPQFLGSTSELDMLKEGISFRGKGNFAQYRCQVESFEKEA